MKTINFGVYPTMITPFTEDNHIDFEAVEKIIKMYNENGCTGIFAVCQSSEMFFLTIEEKIALSSAVVKAARECNPRTSIVASGHTSESISEQAYEIEAIHNSGVDSVVLVSNRLAKEEQDDNTWIKNAEILLSKLPDDISMGVYECPFPYKRLLTPQIIDWCISTKRFSFIKDTCCDPDMLESRLKQLEDSEIKHFNANAQTLYHSLLKGGAGYSGVMANFHPKLYSWLCDNYKDSEKASRLAGLLSMCAFTESLSYPVTAKYHMNLSGIDMTLKSRSRNVFLKEYDKFIIRQMKQLTDYEEVKLYEGI